MSPHLANFTLIISLVCTSVVNGQPTNVVENGTTVGLQNTQFLSEAYNQTKDKTFQSLTASYKNTDQVQQIFYSDLKGQFYWQNSFLSTLNVKEIFLSFQSSKANFRLGRSLHNWSQVDQVFDLGVIQPLDRTTSLDLDQQGLAGIFIELQNSTSLRSTVFASPLFVPDQGAAYQIEDGNFKQVNPWFTAPPKEVLVNGNLTQVNYKVQTPQISKVVSQKSLGLNLQYIQNGFKGSEYGNGFLFNGSVLYKPVEQLQLIYDGYLSPDLTIETRITPVVNQHSAIAGDFGYSFNQLNLIFSGIFEKQESIAVKDQETISLYEPLTVVSIAAQFPVRGLKNSIAIVGSQGGEKKVTGSLSNYIQTWLPNRMPFKDAAKWETYYNWENHFNLGFEYLSSLDSSFSVVKINSGYFVTNNMKISGKLLLVAAEEKSRTVSSDFYNYQDNDQFQIGLNYVF